MQASGFSDRVARAAGHVGPRRILLDRVGTLEGEENSRGDYPRYVTRIIIVRPTSFTAITPRRQRNNNKDRNKHLPIIIDHNNM